MIIVACTIATLHAGIEGGKPSFSTRIQRTTRRRDDQSLYFEAQDIWRGQDWKSPDTCHQASPFRYVYTHIIHSSCTQHKLLRRSRIRSGPLRQKVYRAALALPAAITIPKYLSPSSLLPSQAFPVYLAIWIDSLIYVAFCGSRSSFRLVFHSSSSSSFFRHLLRLLADIPCSSKVDSSARFN